MIALGCDHGGYELMQEVIKHLEERGLEYKNFGCYSTESVDYPIYGQAAAKAVASGECDKGIIICGTGIGISISANKIKGYQSCALPRLLLSSGYQRAQRCEYACYGSKSHRTGTGSQDSGYIPRHTIFK